MSHGSPPTRIQRRGTAMRTHSTLALALLGIACHAGSDDQGGGTPLAPSPTAGGGQALNYEPVPESILTPDGTAMLKNWIGHTERK